MNRIKNIIAVVAILFSLNGYGQTFYTNLSYDISFPMGDTRDFIEKTSFRGASFELGWYVENNLAVDLRFSWHTFYQDMPTDTYTDGTQSVTGKQFRYINSFPITAGVNYYFVNDGIIRVYGGAGLGTYKQNVRTDMGVYYVEDKPWHFGFYPEIGLNWEFSYGVGLSIFARYDVTLKTRDYNGNSYLTIGIGFNFTN